MTKVKYVRVSSILQNTARQEVNSADFAKMYIDKCSGALKLEERKEGKKLLNDINSGIVTEVHVASIDRLGRNVLDILTVIEFFFEKQINLFIENTGMYSIIGQKPNPTFKLIISVLGNVAEMERSVMLERQRQGIELAKQRGVYTGRKYGSRMTAEQFLAKHKKVVKELKDGQSLRRAGALGNCSLGTVQKVQRLLKATIP